MKSHLQACFGGLRSEELIRNLLSILLAILFPLNVLSASNLLQNPSFEVAGSTVSNAYNWEWENPDWHGSTWGAASRQNWNHYPSYTGSWEGTILGTWAELGDNSGWWQEVPAVPGATYELSAWLWADDGNPYGPWTSAVQGLKIEFHQGQAVGTNLLSAVTNTFDDIVQSWTRKAVSGIAPAGSEQVRAVIFAEGVGAEGSLQFDSVALTTVGNSVYPQSVMGISVSRTNNDLVLNWDSVTTDIYGRSKSISLYNLYGSVNPRFVPDRYTHLNITATSSVTSLTVSNVFISSTSTFYYLTAIDAEGLESLVFTDMVYKISQGINCDVGSNAFAWLSLPYISPWTNASSLAIANDEVDKLYRFNDTNQSYEVWDAVAATGTDFRLIAGEAYGVEVSTTTVVHAYGKHSWSNAFAWDFSTNRFNHHWISVPPNAAYETASNLALTVPGCTKVARYDLDSERFASWFFLGGQWMGSNFDLAPGEGILVSIASNTAWVPDLIYPKAEFSISSPAGFVDTASAIEMTGTVVYTTAEIDEYAWDYEGDGELDAVSGSADLLRSRSYTNAGTRWPTFRIKDEQGFYALAYRRYDAVSMTLGFSNQAFRAGLGETGLVSYASSTGGYFSVYIYDESNNLVRVLESNVWHETGSAELGWDGRDETSQLVSNGVYYTVVQQTIGSNTISYDPRGLVLGSNITADITGIALASSFNPYAGGDFPIQYTLPSPSLVTVLIENQSNVTIAVVCSNALRAAGSNIEYWDGRLVSGGMIPAGQQFDVSIDARSIGDNAMVVISPVPSIDNLASSCDRFMPAINPYGLSFNSITMSYDLSASADVRIEIRDINGQVIQDGLEPAKSAGPNQTIWNGTDISSRLVSEGLYSISLRCDIAGVVGAPASIWVEVYY